MIVVTLALWMGLVFMGFTLLYYAGMNQENSQENFFFSPKTGPSFGSALYLSGVTLVTLGYGDITPSSSLYEALTFGVFVAELGRDKETSDRWLARFLAQEAYMRRLVPVDDPPDPEELYARYKEWLPFTYRITGFVEATTKDLGYDIEGLSRDPDQVLFFEDL